MPNVRFFMLNTPNFRYFMCNMPKFRMSDISVIYAWICKMSDILVHFYLCLFDYVQGHFKTMNTASDENKEEVLKFGRPTLRGAILTKVDAEEMFGDFITESFAMRKVKLTGNRHAYTIPVHVRSALSERFGSEMYSVFLGGFPV